MTLQLDEGPENPIDLPYYDDAKWIIMETLMPGDLGSTSKIHLRYSDRDILCIEMLALESVDTLLHFDIIQANYT